MCIGDHRIKSEDVWIGLTRKFHPLKCGTEGWEWDDGSEYNHDQFHHWISGEPAPEAKCAYWNIPHGSGESGWKGTANCNEARHYICKIGKTLEVCSPCTPPSRYNVHIM